MVSSRRGERALAHLDDDRALAAARLDGDGLGGAGHSGTESHELLSLIRGLPAGSGAREIDRSARGEGAWGEP